MQVLDLQGNQLSMDLVEVPPISSLHTLRLSENKIGHSSLARLQGATGLVNLHLRGCGLKGKLPTALWSLQNLKALSLSDNSFTGTFPSEITSLGSLTQIFLYNNDLSGTLPTQFALLTNLKHLSLGLNFLEGHIPSALAMLPELQHVSMEDQRGAKKLIGEIPPFTKAARLRYVANLFCSISTNTVPDMLTFPTTICKEPSQATSC